MIGYENFWIFLLKYMITLSLFCDKIPHIWSKKYPENDLIENDKWITKVEFFYANFITNYINNNMIQTSCYKEYKVHLKGNRK